MKEIWIVRNKISEYTVVIPDEATKCENYAADELVKYVKLTTGDELKVVKESESKGKNLIYIGRCLNTARHVEFSKYGEEGFVITVFDNCLFITGNEKRGTLYGVYTFLENYCGWRFFAHDCEVMYPDDVFLEEGLYDEQIPYMEWRDVCIAAYLPCDIAVKRKINSSYRREFTEEMGGSYLYPGRFIHTMESLVGVPQLSQPCFSDENVLNTCIENVRKLLRENPDARVISVSQNDNTFDEDNFCTCEKCKKIDEEEGSHAGTLLRFVNAVADAIKTEFPKVSIMTLAYLHTTECPKVTIPRDNVIIEFAPMHLCYNHAADDPNCEINRKLLSDFRDWGKIAKRIYLWDYCANFSFTVPHHPDFHVLRRNMAYYVHHNVYGMFCEGDNYLDDHTTDMAELRAYLLSKLLWNPYMSEEEYNNHMEEFLLGYYGKGGKYIMKYLSMLEEAVSDPDRHIRCYQNPTMLVNANYMLLNDDKMTKLWMSALELAETETEKEHVKRSYLGYQYLSLLYTFDEKMIKAESEEERNKLIAENKAFYEALKKNQIEPRGWQTKLPEITDFTESAGVKIYW